MSHYSKPPRLVIFAFLSARKKPINYENILNLQYAEINVRYKLQSWMTGAYKDVLNDTLQNYYKIQIKLHLVNKIYGNLHPHFTSFLPK